MNKYTTWAIAGAIIAAAATAWYVMRGTSSVTPVTETATSAATASESVPAIQHPLADADESPTVSNVDDSDTAIQSSLTQLFGTEDLAEVLIPTQIIRHLVVSIDNLPRTKLAISSRPIKATPGQFTVTGPETDRVIAEANYARYARIMHIVQIADITQVAAWYRHHFSLFQQAYQGLGYPQGYFNDRLVQAIDDLLATPELTTPIHLTQPKVFYEFADPDLESRSAGQKILLRMGPDNTKLVKQKLRELRADITKP